MDFWASYNDHYGPIRKYLGALLKDDTLADDLAQDVFVKAQKGFDTLEDERRIRPWLFRIARNRCLDHFRSAEVSRRSPDGPALIERIADAPVERVLEQQEMSECVQAKLEQLPEAHRTVLILYDMLGMSHREIGEVLEISEGSAKVRLHRARKAAKEVLERHCEFEHDDRNVFVCLPKEGRRED